MDLQPVLVRLIIDTFLDQGARMAPNRFSRALGALLFDSDDVTELEQTWQTQSHKVDAIEFGSIAALPGSFSRTVAELRSASGPADAATASVAERLMAMSVALNKFNVDSVAADRAAAQALESLVDR